MWHRLQVKLDGAQHGLIAPSSTPVITRKDNSTAASVAFELRSGVDAWEVLMEATSGLEVDSDIRQPFVCRIDRTPTSSLMTLSQENNGDEPKVSFSIKKAAPIYGLRDAFPTEFMYYRSDIADIAAEEVEGLVGAYILSQVPPKRNVTVVQEEEENDIDWKVRELETLGASVFAPGRDGHVPLKWTDLAGSETLQRKIEETLTLYLTHPEVYSSVTARTRKRPDPEGNRPRAVLFEGPPGCGKTTAAKILASQAGIVLVHVPIESIVSKWYGESEKQIRKIFEAANKLGCMTLIFLDEVDALAPSRDRQNHEASRRTLSVLLRLLDGMEKDEGQSIVIAATNRRQDLDPALLSRFNISLTFPLPEEPARREIFELYAMHLTETELAELARQTPGMSGRDILDICQDAERTSAGRIIRKGGTSVTESELPKLDDYLSAIRLRQSSHP